MIKQILFMLSLITATSTIIANQSDSANDVSRTQASGIFECACGAKIQNKPGGIAVHIQSLKHALAISEKTAKDEARTCAGSSSTSSSTMSKKKKQFYCECGYSGSAAPASRTRHMNSDGHARGMLAKEKLTQPEEKRVRLEEDASDSSDESGSSLDEQMSDAHEPDKPSLATGLSSTTAAAPAPSASTSILAILSANAPSSVPYAPTQQVQLPFKKRLRNIVCAPALDPQLVNPALIVSPLVIAASSTYQELEFHPVDNFIQLIEEVRTAHTHLISLIAIADNPMVKSMLESQLPSTPPFNLTKQALDTLQLHLMNLRQDRLLSEQNCTTVKLTMLNLTTFAQRHMAAIPDATPVLELLHKMDQQNPSE